MFYSEMRYVVGDNAFSNCSTMRTRENSLCQVVAIGNPNAFCTHYYTLEHRKVHTTFLQGNYF